MNELEKIIEFVEFDFNDSVRHYEKEHASDKAPSAWYAAHALAGIIKALKIIDAAISKGEVK